MPSFAHRVTGLHYWVLAVALFGGTARVHAAASQADATQLCGVDQTADAQFYFADSTGKNEWRKYLGGSAPELSNNGGKLARVWLGPGGRTLVRIEEPGEDFNIYSAYCFELTGQLTELSLEVRTAWGWGYREWSIATAGISVRVSSEFFSTKTNKRVTKPAGANDIPEALKPRVYLQKSQLPFYMLLSK